MLWLNEIQASPGILAAAGEPDEVGLEALQNALLVPYLERPDARGAARAAL